VFADAGKIFCVDPPAVLPRKAVERHLGHRVLRHVLPRHPVDDLCRDIAGVHSFTFDRAEVDHRGLREVEVLDRVPARVHDKAALCVRDLAVREILRGARIPRVVCDLRLVVVVAERDVVKPVREDRAVQLVLHHGSEPLVPDRGRKPVGHEHVGMIARELDLVVGRAVVLRPEHVGNQVEDRIPELHVLVPELVGGRDRGRVVLQHLIRRGRVPGLDHAVVPGDHHERDLRRVQPFERFEHGGIGPGLGLHGIEEVACVDEDVGVLPDYYIYR